MAMTLEADTNVSRCCLGLVQRALPVVSPDQLLSEVAGVWSRVSGHSTLLVSCVCNGMLCGLLMHRGRPLPFQSPAETDSWSATAAADGMLSLIDDGPALLTAMTVVPFQSGGQSVGGVLLPGAGDNEAEFGPLPNLCGSLFAQLRHLSDIASEAILSQSDTESPVVVDESGLQELKLEAMAEFAAGAGHEINNPVATIAGRAALLLKSETDPERRRALETIGGQAYRIRDMIGDAMSFARPPEPRREYLAAAAAIREVTEQFQRSPLANDVSIEMKIDENVELDADPEQFRVVISCLLKNSLEAVERCGGGQIRVSLQPASNAATQDSTNDSESVRGDQWVQLTVSDNGPGLSDVEREHMFDPFFSGRQAGRGLGFGLSRCWRIVRMHGGQIEAHCPESSGLEIRIHWPQFRESE
jgi:signal transduction histidine kinase